MSNIYGEFTSEFNFPGFSGRSISLCPSGYAMNRPFQLRGTQSVNGCGGSRTAAILTECCCARLNLTIDVQLVIFDSPPKKFLISIIVCNIARFRLILPEVTAIGIRLSHASREGSALGGRLSNT